MTATDAPADLPPQPDPPQDERIRPVPPHIADVLAVLHILLGYGRHLSLTLEHRSTAWGYSVIAQFFGTARVELILARVSRGILRIMALQRVLLNRARRGRDLVWLQPYPPRPPRKPKQTTQGQAEASSSHAHPLHRRRTDEAPDPDNLPTLAQLEAEIRRHRIGRAIADICLDFGISPGLCGHSLWNNLFDVISGYRGNLPRYIRTIRRREVAFEPHMNASPPLQLPAQTRQGIQRMLGFFIGDQWPIMPYPVPLPSRLREAATTGPP